MTYWLFGLIDFLFENNVWLNKYYKYLDRELYFTNAIYFDVFYSTIDSFALS